MSVCLPVFVYVRLSVSLNLNGLDKIRYLKTSTWDLVHTMLAMIEKFEALMLLVELEVVKGQKDEN